MTSLHKLISNVPAMRDALNAGADPDERDASGNTPLHAAAWDADLAAVRELLAHGADVNARNHRGVPVLHEAVRRGNAGLATLLVEAGAAVTDHADDDQSTALHWAAKDGALELARLLIQRGAPLDAVDALGRTPLQWVLPRADYAYSPVNRRAMIEFLLSTGAGHSLEDAIARGTREQVAHWLSRGTAPTARLSDGGSALGLAAERGAAVVVRLLVGAGASPDGEPFDARNPLVRAVSADRPEIVEILLRAGAHPERGGLDGVLPLDAHVERARIAGKPGACGELLIAYGAHPTPQWAVIHDSPEVLRQALAAGWNVDRVPQLEPDRTGRTALVLAAEEDRPAMVAALLEAGADPMLADEFGRTPLHAAAEPCAQRIAVAELLLKAGADPNDRDSQGRTPLHVALQMLRSYCVSVELVRVLVAAGADPRVRDAQGATPFQVDRPGYLDVDVNENVEDVARRRDAAVAAVSEILGTAGPGRGDGC